MMGNTHMTGGVVAALSVITVSGITSPALMGLGTACAVSGSLFPDIDHPNSKLSRRNQLCSAISNLVCSLTTHRGFCHTVPFLLLMGAGWWLVFVLFGSIAENHLDAFFYETAKETQVPLFRYIANWNVTFGMQTGCWFFLAGILSHLILDTLNPEGILWLYPFRKKRFHLLSIKTDSNGERLVRVVLVLLILLWALLVLNQRGSLHLF